MKFQRAVHDFKKPQDPETVKTEEFLGYVVKHLGVQRPIRQTLSCFTSGIRQHLSCGLQDEKYYT